MFSLLKGIFSTPAVTFRSDTGKTYQPPTVRANIVVHVNNCKRWSCTMPLRNRKNSLLEEAQQYVPEKFGRILSAEIRPRIKPGGPADVAMRIRFDCEGQ